jgi:DNA-damage-inducible protein J
MSVADTYVRARIDSETKARAADALEAMGLSISDAIRLLMLRVANERRLPFDVRAPNAKTRKAIAELESGKGQRFENPERKR